MTEAAPASLACPEGAESARIAGLPTKPAPCRCHQTHAYIAPFHRGHCCFWPPTSTCHPAEVAEWERQSNLRRALPTEVRYV